MPRRTLILLLVSIAVSYACYWRADRTPYARYLAEALEVIDQNYVEPVDDQKLFDGAMEGMVGRLDDYSGFISHEEATRFQQSLDQKFGGVGIEVSLDPKTEQLTVTTPVPNTPAYREGVQAGDTIVAINGESVEKIPPKERLKTAIDLLRGKEGEPVSLRVARAGEPEPIDFRLVRAIIHVDSVLGDTRQSDNSWNFILAGHPGIGYVRVNSFGEQTVAEFSAAMQWLTQHDCRGLIIDLRNNPGGLLTSARDLCDMFIQAGQVIVTTKDRDHRTREEYRGSGRGLYQKLPLVVLVNSGSASASEILAACLQDQGRAKIVGQRTWGKGTVQHVIPVEGGQSVLRLTTASYWRPNGRNIHRFRQSNDEDSWGVSPDDGCEVAMDDKQITAWLEERRRRDVVYPPGKSSVARKLGTASDFDPFLKSALELLAAPADGEAAQGDSSGQRPAIDAAPSGR